jgi:hypothetical protein
MLRPWPSRITPIATTSSWYRAVTYLDHQGCDAHDVAAHVKQRPAELPGLISALVWIID